MGHKEKSAEEILSTAGVGIRKKKLVSQLGHKIKLSDIDGFEIIKDPSGSRRVVMALLLIGFAALVCLMYLFGPPGGGVWVDPREWNATGHWLGSSKILIWAPLLLGIGLLAWSRMADTHRLVVYRSKGSDYPFRAASMGEKRGVALTTFLARVANGVRRGAMC